MLPLRTVATLDVTAASSLSGFTTRFHATVPFHTRLEPTVTSGVDEFNGYAEEEDMLGMAFSTMGLLSLIMVMNVLCSAGDGDEFERKRKVQVCGNRG